MNEKNKSKKSIGILLAAIMVFSVFAAMTPTASATHIKSSTIQAPFTAGAGQKSGQRRAELVAKNREIIRSIIESMKPINRHTIIIMVTNPVDVLTTVAQEVAELPRNQVFGSGTFLDTQRLRSCLAAELNVGQQSVHAYVLGEHGDNQFVTWSNADIGGVPLSQFNLSPSVCERMAIDTREKVYEIIEAKGSTCFGVAACISAYCENILFDQKRVLPLSCYLEKYNVCLSMPVVLGARGVEQILDVPLNATENQKLYEAVEKVCALYEEK